MKILGLDNDEVIPEIRLTYLVFFPCYADASFFVLQRLLNKNCVINEQNAPARPEVPEITPNIWVYRFGAS